VVANAPTGEQNFKQEDVLVRMREMQWSMCKLFLYSRICQHLPLLLFVPSVVSDYMFSHAVTSPGRTCRKSGFRLLKRGFLYLVAIEALPGKGVLEKYIMALK
jgi:hypothetical protein